MWTQVRVLYLLGGVLGGSPSLGGFVASLLGVVLGSIGCLRGFSLSSRVGILSSIPCVSHGFVGIVPTAFQNTERSRREQQTMEEKTKYRYVQSTTFPNPPVHLAKNPLLQDSYEHSSPRGIQVIEIGIATISMLYATTTMSHSLINPKQLMNTENCC